MPTIFIIFGFRFQFYSNDHTPIHVHVVKGTSRAKYNLFPVELINNQGFKPSELKLIESIIEEEGVRYRTASSIAEFIKEQL